MSETEFCREIIEPFVWRTQNLPVQIMGGNGSAALTSAKTEIDLDTGVIYAPEDCNLSVIRENGTLRDVDVLVKSVDEGVIEEVDSILEETVGDRLKRSVFGLKPLIDMDEQLRRPVHSTAFVQLGDRYVEGEVDENGIFRIDVGYKSLFPFSAEISDEVLETFLLFTGNAGMATPTSHPGATILNYVSRSISGVRPKDTEKLIKIVDNLLPRYPELKDWIIDGPGKENFELARVLHTLRISGRSPKTLHLGNNLDIVPYSLGELQEHDLFMASNLSERAQKRVIRAAHAKSRLIHFGESQQWIVKWWQEVAEERIKGIVHNEHSGESITSRLQKGIQRLGSRQKTDR